MQDTMSTPARRMMVAKQMTTPMPVKTTGTTMRSMVVKTRRMLAKITTTKASAAMLATTRKMEGKTTTTTRQMTMAMLVGAVTKKTMTLGTTPMTPTMGKKTKRKRLIWRKTMQMSMLSAKKPKIWNKWLRVSLRLAVYPVLFPPLKYSLT
jgi:hypothetical protein